MRALQILTQMTLSELHGGFAPESWVREKTGAHQTSLHHAEQWPLRLCEPSYCVGYPGKRLLHANNDAVKLAGLRSIGHLHLPCQ
jgi:hypothetical protein